MNKEDIRTRIRARRRQLKADWVAERSAVIQTSVVALPEFREAAAVALYMAIEAEVHTDDVATKGYAQGKQILVPAWDREQRRYRMAVLDRSEARVAGPMGIPEPTHPRWTDLAGGDLVLVPGLAFDRQGGRIGHGAGHYDRLLSPLKNIPICRVGLAFDFQIVDQMQTAEHDIAMDLVVTESKTIRC